MKLLCILLFSILIQYNGFSQLLEMEDFIFVNEHIDSLSLCEKYLAKKGYFRHPSNKDRLVSGFYYNFEMIKKKDRYESTSDAVLICSSISIILGTKHKWIFDYYYNLALTIGSSPYLYEPTYDTEYAVSFALDPYVIHLKVKPDKIINEHNPRKYEISFWRRSDR